MIDWDDTGTEVLLNPRMPRDTAARTHELIRSAGHLPAHVWLTTSGATGRAKPVALAKRALLASAAAVNEHIRSDAADTWVNVLPTFHVGGLGIHARAHLSGARVTSLPEWSPEAFRDLVREERATLSALVPSQVFDLVRGNVRAPASLRAVIVGGGPLGESLYGRGRELDWPLLPSYGCTECCSQVATAELRSLDGDAFPSLALLAHLDARVGAEGILEFRGTSLFTGYAGVGGLTDPKSAGWWRSEDRGDVRHRTLTVLGRATEVLKVGGELVSMAHLQTIVEEEFHALDAPGDAVIVPVSDDRLGNVLHLVVCGMSDGLAGRLRTAYDARVLPFERARGLRMIESIPRSPLGKVLWEELGRTLDRASP